MKPVNTPKVTADKLYKLLSRSAPLSYMLPTRNTRRFPLLWFDEENGINRALRYARNQKTPFEDEQDGNAILEPIIFDNGFLNVSKDNPVLQHFLYYHPLNGKTFGEVNEEKDAQSEVDKMNSEIDALSEARGMSLEQLENVARVLLGKDTSRMTTAEMRRDVLVNAKKDPQGFLTVIGDPTLKLQAKIQMFFDNKLLGYRNNNREVWLNTPTVKRKLIIIPFGEDPKAVVASYIQSDEGVEVLKMMENIMESPE